jgi:DnaJ family protein A protein 2
MRRTLPRSGIIQQFSATCTDCEGRGQYVTEKCKECNGRCKIVRENELKIHVKPGMVDGQRIILRGEGDEWPGRTTGDLIYVIHQVPHPLFTRRYLSSLVITNNQRGDDLYMHKTITLLQALTGFEIVIPTLDGDRQLCVTVDEVIQPGQCKAIDNAGMPLYDPSVKTITDRSKHKYGKLIIVFQVVFPQHLNRELKGYLKLLLDPKIRDKEKIPTLKELHHIQLETKEETTNKSSDDKIEHVRFMPGTVPNPFEDGVPTATGEKDDTEGADVKEKTRKKSVRSSFCAQQ